jgi:hypothetical protein
VIDNEVMVLMIPIWNRHGWRIKIHFQQNDGSTLKAQLVAFEIYSYDIITEGYFDSLLFAIHFMNMGLIAVRLYL